MTPFLIAGACAGAAGLLVFLVLHHVWIQPIWFIAPDRRHVAFMRLYSSFAGLVIEREAPAAGRRSVERYKQALGG